MFALYLPNDSNPLFNMLSFIVFGIETKLVVALRVFFFFGFSKSAYLDVDLKIKKIGNFNLF